jgi:hypothetical protein
MYAVDSSAPTWAPRLPTYRVIVNYFIFTGKELSDDSSLSGLFALKKQYWTRSNGARARTPLLHCFGAGICPVRWQRMRLPLRSFHSPRQPQTDNLVCRGSVATTSGNSSNERTMDVSCAPLASVRKESAIACPTHSSSFRAW